VHQHYQEIYLKKLNQYLTIKNQWQSITEEQSLHFSKFVFRRNLLEKDTIRTERNHPLFSDLDSPYLKILFDVLLTYSFYNFDIGYCQGMNDLLAPFLLLLKNEAESFWCYAGIMQRLSKNFEKDGSGIQQQFNLLERILYYLDPVLHQHFRSSQLINMFICYRWILIAFRREFTLEDTYILWEVWFSGYVSIDFHLFVAIGIFIRNRDEIMKYHHFDDLLQYLSTLSLKLNVIECIRTGQALMEKFMNIADEDLRKKVMQNY